MLQIKFDSFPILLTERLVLRQLKPEDAAEIFTLRSDESVNQYLDRPKAATIEDAKEFIAKIINSIKKNESFYWAITLKNTEKLIGTICYWNINKKKSIAETGYELLPAYQGKGIMQEAFSKVIEFGFQTMQLEIIEAYTHPDNNNSSKLLEKNNFKRVENQSDNKQENVEEIIYVLTKP